MQILIFDKSTIFTFFHLDHCYHRISNLSPGAQELLWSIRSNTSSSISVTEYACTGDDILFSRLIHDYFELVYAGVLFPSFSSNN